MVDTLKVALTDYSVSPNNGLTVVPSPLRFDTDAGAYLPVRHRLLWNNSAGPREGDRAYLNTERFNLTLGPMPGNARYAVPSGSGCWVQLSVPKYYGANNLQPVDGEEAGAVLHGLERELSEAGVQTNINRARVVRLDTFRNVVAEEPFGSYQPLFDMLEAKRTHKRDYGTTCLWHNGQREFCVYDKREELRLAGSPTRGLPANLLRFEHRLLNGRTVEAALGFGTVGELLSGWSGLGRNYEDAMRHNLFRREVPEVETLAASQFESDLLSFKATGARYWLENCLEAIGVQQVYAGIGAEAFKAILERHCNRGTVLRKLRKSEELRFRLEAARLSAAGQTMADLYGELRSKVLAA